MKNLYFRVILNCIMVLTLISIQKVKAQEKPKPSKDEISIPVYIHGLKDKNDVEKVQDILMKQSWVKFVQVEDWPQKHTHLIIKNSVTPDMVNSVLKAEGFNIINKSFLDNRDTEHSLVESHKQNNYKAEQFKK